MRTFIFLILILVSCKSIANTDVVSFSGRQLLVNNLSYTIKGVCYHPVPKGSDKRSFENLSKDLALMKEAGINTIRIYEPIIEKEVLDEIDAAGIKVIVGFGYNQNGNNDILSGTFIDYVNTFKSHNAILFWELGNEYNYHPVWFNDDIKNWYTALNNAAELIHQNDSSHPVATAHGELPDSLALSSCPNIDVWGMNVYRWDNPESIFAQWGAISSKPMYLSEAGADSYMTITKSGYEKGENEKAQADALANIMDATFRNQQICMGVTLFAFVDEFWKAGNNNQLDPGGWAPNSSGVPYDGSPNEEYWGIVDINRNKKKAFEVVKEKYLDRTQILKNKNLEIRIDLPLENYNFSRFDWTGKIVAVKYKDIYVSGVERTDDVNDDFIGRGFYNEFGIDAPVGFDETVEGEWFHKIGIGLLKKDSEPYDISKKYEIKPADFTFTTEENKLTIKCKSLIINGYSYVLTKEIELFESSFRIQYRLQNTGEKTISTNEYTHNFLAINNDLIGSNYILKFPFQIKTGLGEIVNPEEKVEVGSNEITFNNTPNEQFFYSNLSGNENVEASWELINTKSKIGIRETGSFNTNKVNLWGWKHVISPELFFDVLVQPGEVTEWSRTYTIFETN
jgi:hypothetical protein